MGIMVQAYQADNSIFVAHAFVNNIESSLQNIKFSSAGAHHQNGIAERAIQSILSKARTILMHAAIGNKSLAHDSGLRGVSSQPHASSFCWHAGAY